jgi:inorganic pyrophosphatase
MAARAKSLPCALDNLRGNLPAEIGTFFGNYNRLNGGDFRATGRGNVTAARRAVEKAKERLKFGEYRRLSAPFGR